MIKTLITTLLTFLLVISSQSHALSIKPLPMMPIEYARAESLDKSIFFTSPEKCSNMLITIANQEISSSLASKYGECINSHLSKITGMPVDGKVVFFPSSGYIGMNIYNLRKVTDNKFNRGPFKWRHIEVQWSSLSDDDNPFEWHANPKDGYKFIRAYKFLGWRWQLAIDF